MAIYDLLALAGPAVRLPLIAGYHARLLAGELPKLKRQLVELAEQRRTREPATGGLAGLVPTLITDVAKPSVVEACLRA